MSRLRTRKKPMAQMNVVPYIDVMLVLLVIFMVTAPMMQTGVQVDLPDAEAEPLESDNQEEPLIVSVDQEGRFYLEDDSEVMPGDIAEYVNQKVAENPKRQIYVKAATDVEYNYVMQAMVAIQQGGAQSIGLMADPVPVEQ